MARGKKLLTDVFSEYEIKDEKSQDDVSVNSNTKTVTKDVTQKRNTETTKEDVAVKISMSSIKEVADNIMEEYNEKSKKKTVEDTHTRSTFLLRKDLDDRLNKLCKNKKRGFKTLFLNKAIEILLDELES